MAIQILSIASGMKLIKDYLDNTAEKSATDKFLNGNFKKTGSITKLLKTLVVEPTIIVSEEARIRLPVAVHITHRLQKEYSIVQGFLCLQETVAFLQVEKTVPALR